MHACVRGVCICCSPLIGGLNGSLGSRVNSGLLDPSTPRGSRSSLNPAAQGSPGQNASGRGHQASDMQVCSMFASFYRAHDLPTMLDPSTPRGSRSSLNPAAQGSPGQKAAGCSHQASNMQAPGSALLCGMLHGLLSVPEQP